MEKFNFAAWHEELGSSGAWMDDVTASALQHWHDRALSIWNNAGSPELPVSPQADWEDGYATLPPFARWLVRHSPATGKWFSEQEWAESSEELNNRLYHSAQFWQCCAMFINTLNTAYEFV